MPASAHSFKLNEVADAVLSRVRAHATPEALLDLQDTVMTPRYRTPYTGPYRPPAIQQRMQEEAELLVWVLFCYSPRLLGKNSILLVILLSLLGEYNIQLEFSGDNSLKSSHIIVFLKDSGTPFIDTIL